MTLAFVLVNSEPGAEERVLAALKSIEVVKETYLVKGVYDIIVRIEAPGLATLTDSGIAQIRQLENIRNTFTMITAENKKGIHFLLPHD